MSIKILIVDDSATVRQQVRLALQQAGFDIVEAVDGVDGIEKLSSHRDVRLVIADVNMPRMNGLEMVESIAKNPALNSVPIVMLTTEGNPDLVRRAKDAGAKGWIVKPFKAHLLVAAAQKLAA
ncbi:MAG: response regulator [Myxococcales bacterium]|nr:response regulator [Myxococcales bacterium]MCB9731854.1 response regulator [Deltaproteobacteria bacterium]